MTPGASDAAIHPDALPEGLEQLLSNPEFQSRFQTVLQALKNADLSGAPEIKADSEESVPSAPSTPVEQSDPFPQEPSAEPVSAMGSGIGGDGLAAILSNPALMGMLPGLLSGMRAPAPGVPTPKSPDQRRRDLLLALKPFLSKERGNAIDVILRISQLGSVIRGMR